MKTMMTAVAVVAVLAMAMNLTACKSDESGVKTSYRSQWTQVAANTEKTTNAAKAVLNDMKLTDVKAASTAVDGEASGKMADGTSVKVSIKKKDAGSEVTVVVGTMGDPSLGAKVASDIKKKAEGN